MAAVSQSNVNFFKKFTQKVSNAINNRIVNKINLIDKALVRENMHLHASDIEQRIVKMLLPKNVIEKLNLSKAHVLIDDDVLYFAVEKQRTAESVKAELIDITGKLVKNLEMKPARFDEALKSGGINSAEDFRNFYNENKKLCGKQILKTKLNNIIAKFRSLKKSQPKFSENKELEDAFYNYKYVDKTGYARTFGNAYGLKAIILGKKPATYFDDVYDKNAKQILLNYAKDIEKQTKGKIKIIKMKNDCLILFNMKTLKKTVSQNLDFYKYHFPTCKNETEIVKSIIEKAEKTGLDGSLLGVTLGFPLGDAVLFGSTVGDKIPQKTMLSLLKGAEWAKHREVIKAGKMLTVHGK